MQGYREGGIDGRASRGGLAALALGCLLSVTLATEARAASEQYGFLSAEQTFTVPAGVTSLDVVAIGGAGEASSGSPFFPGGDGAAVTGSIDVTPGQTLYVEVGGLGCNGSGSVPSPGGQGGGATDVRTVSVTDAGGTFCEPVDWTSGAPYYQSGASVDSRLIVAAGGGGGGYGAFGGDGAPGGSAEQAGFGVADSGGRTVTGGGAASTTAGGSGGELQGSGAGAGTGSYPGGLGYGGTGGFNAEAVMLIYAGAGGAGLYGGGGGTAWKYSGDHATAKRIGSGGGGGSNLVPVGGTETTSDEAPSVTFTWAVPPFAAEADKGTITGGTFEDLAGNDDEVLKVKGKSGKVSWNADFESVANNASDLTLTYRGSNSKKCTQKLSLYNDQTARFTVADKRDVGAKEKKVVVSASDLPGAPADYVQFGIVEASVSCKVKDGNVTSLGDQMTVLDE